MAVFGEYIQALVSHLWTREPRKWGDLQDQVYTDTWSLLGVFGEHGVSRRHLGWGQVLGAPFPFPAPASL